MNKGCDGCKEILQEVKNLETIANQRHDAHLKRMIDYEVDKATNTSSMKALHKRLDEYTNAQSQINNTLVKHMEDEKSYYLEVTTHMVRTNELLQHLAPKDSVTKVNGRVNTIWIIGSAVIAAVGLMSSYFMIEGFKAHVTKSSKANFQGLKKVIEEEAK